MSKAERKEFFRRAREEGLVPKEIIEACWDKEAWPAAPFEGNPGKVLQELGVAAKFMVSLGLHKVSGGKVFACKPDPPDVEIKLGNESVYFEVTNVLSPGDMPGKRAIDRERREQQFEKLATEAQKNDFLQKELDKPEEAKRDRQELERLFPKMARDRLVTKAEQYRQRAIEEPAFLSSRPTFGVLLHSRIEVGYAAPLSETEGFWANWLSEEDRAICELFPDIYLDDSNSLTFLSVCFRKNGTWLQQPVFSREQNPWFQ